MYSTNFIFSLNLIRCYFKIANTGNKFWNFQHKISEEGKEGEKECVKYVNNSEVYTLKNHKKAKPNKFMS